MEKTKSNAFITEKVSPCKYINFFMFPKFNTEKFTLLDLSPEKLNISNYEFFS